MPAASNDLNTQFPQAGFDGLVKIAPGTQKPRASTGLELQVMLPVVNAPFRLYFAYNPSIVREYLQPPIVADRSSFPNTRDLHQRGSDVRPGVSVLREADACSGSPSAGRFNSGLVCSMVVFSHLGVSA